MIAPSYGQSNVSIFELFAQNEFSTNSENDLLFVCRVSVDDNSKGKEWKKGVLIDYDNKAHEIEGNYDESSDEIQILLHNKSKIIFPQKIKAIKVGETIYIPCEYAEDNSLTYGYFQVLSSRKVDLLKKVEIDKGKTEFYVRRNSEIAKPLKLSKNNILKFLNDERVNKFMRDKNLSLKKEANLIALFDYYNGIE